MRKRTFTEVEIEQIILMAWGDTISFETIERDWGMTEKEVISFMRKHQTPQTYTRWRKRVTARSGASSKHEKLSKLTSRRQKFPI